MTVPRQDAEPRLYGVPPPGARLPDDTRLGPVSLQVGDLQRSIDHYGEVLGLAVHDRAVGSAALGASGAAAPLVHLHARRGIQPAPPRGAYGLYHFALLLPDRAALGRLAAHVASLGVRLGMADHLVSEALYLTDPDGLGIEVYADRPRETWRTHGRELAMASDPLDISAVVAAGAGRQWTGAPAATTMGHVHLHVGDLARAEAFYHSALGFEKVVWSYPGALFLSAGGYHHHLGLNTWSPGPSAADHQARLLDWTIVTPDDGSVARAGDTLRAAGHAVESAGKGWTAADPWGTRVRVVPEPG